jgi:hypothetical protein
VQAAIAHRTPASKRRGRARPARPEIAKADEDDAGEK